ncbi:MAG: DNA repair protein RecN [Acidobacteriota bacterium]|nr:DNA repair protein RecN [Acidobacteriota bacterium]
MLLELAVENYAVIDRLRVRFHSGLNLLTGETGGGKSIVVDALGLLLGGRASADMIRSGEARARVSGRFDLRGNAGAHAILAPGGFESEDGELLIEREILANGKSRAYVSSRPATVTLLKDLAPHLGDIHGQHDQQLLFVPDAQLEMLDEFARNRDLRSDVRQFYRRWRSIETEIAELEGSEKEKLRLLDLWEFQTKEIESAAPQLGEDSALEDERRIQQNLGRLTENATAAFEALYDLPESAYATTRLAIRKLDDLIRIDATLAEVRQTLDPAIIAVQEASYALRDYLSRLESNPARLEEVEARLASLDKLKRKYGGTLDEILAFRDQVRAQITAVENAGERMEALRKERHIVAREYECAAEQLGKKRRAAALDLSARVMKELRGLAMDRTVFQIDIGPVEWSETGADKAAFLVSPNLGEEPRPIEKVASGGEISRIALALKTCLAGSPLPEGGERTLVFDEVDTGIGGGAAEGVARRLKTLAGANQVLCVTHLAQIACFADHHYRVEKVESNGRTVARLYELDADERTREVGRMLSGQRLSPEALKNAAELIRSASS